MGRTKMCYECESSMVKSRGITWSRVSWLFQRELGEVQLISLVSFSPPRPSLPPSPLCSFSIHSSELQPGKIFSKESDVSAKQSDVCYCMCVCYKCVVPTCGPQEHFVAQVTVMCLFLTGCGGVKSLAGHCVKSGIKRKYQHRGLSHTQITHIHYA